MAVLKNFCQAMVFAALLCSPVPSLGQPVLSTSTIEAPPQPGAIALLSDVPDHEIWHEDSGLLAVRNVTRPTLTPILPVGRSTGTAIIIAPGGAFLGLAIEKEGWEIARWFANQGVTAFVLKYRTLPTPVDQAVFVRDLGRLVRGEVTFAQTGFGPPKDTPPEALSDGLAALRYVRAHATDYGIDPHKVGFMGFSAGGFLTRSVVTNAGADMPNFVAPIYPRMASMDVPANAPPMFVAIAADDYLLAGETGFPLISDYRTARRSIEFHLLQSGGHGFGAGKPGTPTEGWLDLMLRWMKVNDFLEDKK